MKYRVIQKNDSGSTYTQETSSYIGAYGIVIQAVGDDHHYIEKIEENDDIVSIYISSGEGYAVSTLNGLKQLYVIHAEEQYLLKRKQLDHVYLLHQDINKELKDVNLELVVYIKEGLEKSLKE